jgi:hypothetical protein
VSYRFSIDDIAFLRSPSGVAALLEIEALPLSSGSYLADVRSVRASLGERAGAVLETVLLRRRAVSKVDDPARWLFTDEALQQATPLPVARHRSTRFAGRDVHDVTCSVGVDLAALSAVARVCVGSDMDPIRVAMAWHNTSAPVLLADALRPVSRGTAVFADPARRDAAGRRRWRPADFSPPLDELAAVYAGRDLAVKCAPGVDFAELPWAAEVELISLDGQVREACLWSGSLAGEGIRRRASVLRSDGTQWTITDASPDDCPVRPAGEWLIDPDGAIVRAGLVRHYACAHGLGQLDERIAYLTGDAPPPGIRAFRVIEEFHYSEKSLRAALRRLDVGRLEILVRGLDIDPNKLRPRLKLSGSSEATAILTRVGRGPFVFLAHAERT